MAKGYNVLIIGDGRIGRAAAHFFSKNNKISHVDFLGRAKDISRYDLLVGAMPGELGQQCTELALKYGKNLIDISDIDPPFYLKKKKEIEKRGILVIPGCGFSPGLVNFILGHEISSLTKIKEIEIKAGSLSRDDFFFPFLWCFEDLTLEHQLNSEQLISRQNKRFPPFAGYQEEYFFDIQAESYFCASGFENLLEKSKAENFTCRVVRPYGFMHFFEFLKNQGFLRKENFVNSKKILEGTPKDNITLGQISITCANKKISWLMKSFSRKNEELNSMQKITSIVPAVIGEFILEDKIPGPGLFFMEDLVRDQRLFYPVIRQIKKNGIYFKKKIIRI